MRNDKVSIVIASYNMKHYLYETLWTCVNQYYKELEIIIYDDCSTDGTNKVAWNKMDKRIKYYRGKENKGVGEAFNEGIKKATGKYIVLMCADDLFTCKEVIFDIVNVFKKGQYIGHVSRAYYQFVDGDEFKRPVRAWRTRNWVIAANNPSGLAFRSDIVKRHKCSNRMFIETSKLVTDVCNEGCGVGYIGYDTIAVRVHNSTSTKPGYWLKRRVSSPVMDWWSIGAREIAQDYVSLIQIKNGFTMKAVLEEIWNFIKLRPKNLLNPGFYFYSIVAIVTPRRILRKLPDLYRRYIGIKITRKIKRPC